MGLPIAGEPQDTMGGKNMRLMGRLLAIMPFRALEMHPTVGGARIHQGRKAKPQHKNMDTGGAKWTLKHRH